MLRARSRSDWCSNKCARIFDAPISLGLWYVLLVTSRQIADAQASRNQRTTVLLVNGLLVTISNVCLSVSIEARMTSWGASDPFCERCDDGSGPWKTANADRTSTFLVRHLS